MNTDVCISETAISLVTVDEVIEGHRQDIRHLELEMAMMRVNSGWVFKIPGFGYDALLKKLGSSVVQLESLLLFREDVLSKLREMSRTGVCYPSFGSTRYYH